MDDNIRELYEQGLSIREIAKKIGRSSTYVYSKLTKLGVEKRSHSEAQKLAIDTGRSQHPTKGKKLSDATKMAIGKSLTDYNNRMTPKQKLAGSRQRSKLWKQRTKTDTAAMTQSGHEGIRQTTKKGSAVERFICHKLTENGIAYDFHYKSPHGSSNLEVDIMLKNGMTAIEVDGPSHFFPIWGDEKLAKTKESDLKKNGLLTGLGYTVIRVQYKKTGTRPSKTRLMAAWEKTLVAIKTGSGLVEIEI